MKPMTKPVIRIDSQNNQERYKVNKKHEERLRASIGMVKQNGKLLKQVTVMVSADDLSAFRHYRSEFLDDGTIHLKGMEILEEMIQKREDLDELIITTSDLLTPLDVRMSSGLHESLKNEAVRHGIDLNSYLRAIIYGHGRAARLRKHERTQKSLAHTRSQRFIQVPFFISPEQRERMFQKHGNMTDDQLVQLAQQQFSDVLSK